MPFAAINSTNRRTNLWNFENKILRIGGTGKWPFCFDYDGLQPKMTQTKPCLGSLTYNYGIILPKWFILILLWKYLCLAMRNIANSKFKYQPNHEQWKVRTIIETEYFFNSLLEVPIRSDKVHTFLEGYKILGNIHLTFDWHYIGQK